MKPTLRKWILALALVTLVALIVVLWQPLKTLLEDLPQLRSWLRGLGPWGPAALILLNAAQIVVAPVPGQLVQAVAGYLFGVWPGALYGALGMALGGTISMTLGRLYGRPLATRMVGAERLARWERVAHTDSPLTWCILLLPPFGDIPYLIAGLTQLPIRKMLVILVLVRWPSAIVHAAIGAGVVTGSPVLYGTLLGGLVVIGVLGLLYGSRLQDWIETRLLGRLPGGSGSSSSSSSSVPDEEQADRASP